MSYHRYSPIRQEKVHIQSNKKIIIYGPYHPENEKKRLYQLKDCLKRRGFKNVYLVSNFPIPIKLPSNQSARNLARSRYCLKNSDLNILIFTFPGVRNGVGFELGYVLQKRFPFIICVELKRQKDKDIRAFSSLLEARLDEFSKSYIDFPDRDDKYLCDVVYYRVIDFFL